MSEVREINTRCFKGSRFSQTYQRLVGEIGSSNFAASSDGISVIFSKPRFHLRNLLNFFQHHCINFRVHANVYWICFTEHSFIEIKIDQLWKFWRKNFPPYWGASVGLVLAFFFCHFLIVAPSLQSPPLLFSSPLSLSHNRYDVYFKRSFTTFPYH